jgi:hypothetical protein
VGKQLGAIMPPIGERAIAFTGMVRDVSRQLAIQRSMIDSAIMTYLMFGSRSLSL